MFDYSDGTDLCTSDYYTTNIQVVNEQIAKQGYRLAAWLNVIFDGSTNLPWGVNYWALYETSRQFTRLYWMNDFWRICIYFICLTNDHLRSRQQEGPCILEFHWVSRMVSRARCKYLKRYTDKACVFATLDFVSICGVRSSSSWHEKQAHLK